MLYTANSEAIDESGGKEKLVLVEECELVTVMDVIKGRLEVTTTHVYFFDSQSNREEGTALSLSVHINFQYNIHVYNAPCVPLHCKVFHTCSQI